MITIAFHSRPGAAVKSSSEFVSRSRRNLHQKIINFLNVSFSIKAVLDVSTRVYPATMWVLVNTKHIMTRLITVKPFRFFNEHKRHLTVKRQ